MITAITAFNIMLATVTVTSPLAALSLSFLFRWIFFRLRFAFGKFLRSIGISSSFRAAGNCFSMLVLPFYRLRGFLYYVVSVKKNPLVNTFCKCLFIFQFLNLYFFSVNYYNVFYDHLHHLSKAYESLFVLVALSFKISYTLITEYQSE